VTPLELASMVLEAHLYKIEGTTANIIFADKDGKKLAALVYTDDANKKTIHNFADHAESDKKLIIAMKSIGTEPYHLGIPVWNRERFMLEVGKCRLAKAEGRAFISEIPELRDIENIVVEVQGTGKIIKPAIGESDAMELAKDIKDAFKIDLMLTPIHLFRFKFTYKGAEDMDAAKEGAEPEFISGLIGVNATNSQADFWDEGILTVDNVKGLHHWLEPVHSQESCIEEATKSIPKRTEDGATIIFERIELKPDRTTLTIEHRGLYYLPVWSIEGSSGMMQIDAVSGKALLKEIYSF
jgi:hypothetical protein